MYALYVLRHSNMHCASLHVSVVILLQTNRATFDLTVNNEDSHTQLFLWHNQENFHFFTNNYFIFSFHLQFFLTFQTEAKVNNLYLCWWFFICFICCHYC